MLLLQGLGVIRSHRAIYGLLGLVGESSRNAATTAAVLSGIQGSLAPAIATLLLASLGHLLKVFDAF